MDSKHTMLLYRTPANESTVAVDTSVVRLNTATRQLDEFRPGAAVPSADSSSIHVYTVSKKPVESIFAVHGAINCTTPTGAAFRPSFCLNIKLRYINPIGLKTLLTSSTAKKGYVPDCVTLEDLYAIIAPQLKAVCEKAADEYSGGRMLSYTHWWQELSFATTYLESLKTPLVTLFNSYGFRFEPEDFSIKGVASIPAT